MLEQKEALAYLNMAQANYNLTALDRKCDDALEAHSRMAGTSSRLIDESPSIRSLRSVIERMAKTDRTILIIGKTEIAGITQGQGESLEKARGSESMDAIERDAIAQALKNCGGATAAKPPRRLA